MPGAIICRRRFVLAGLPGARVRAVRLDFGTLLASIVWSRVAFIFHFPFCHYYIPPRCRLLLLAGALFCPPGYFVFHRPSPSILCPLIPPPSIRPYPRWAAQCINNQKSDVSFGSWL